MVAYHEAGHTIVGLVHQIVVHKVTIALVVVRGWLRMIALQKKINVII